MAKDRKVILITGASSGIGAATARLAARDGYDVAIGFRTDLTGAKMVATDVEAAGGRAPILQADVSQPSGIDQLFADFDAVFPRIDVLVNNAGIADSPARVDEMDSTRLRRIIDLNLIAPILLAGHAVRRMSTKYGNEGGSIINISSVAARLGGAGQNVDYAASKGGMDTFTTGLAMEVAEEGIRVNGVRPGIIDTPIHGKWGQQDRAQRLADSIPMKRPGTAEEIAEAILWLCSGKSSYVTGATLDVTGGR